MTRTTSTLNMPAPDRLLAAVLLPALAICACTAAPSAEVLLAEYVLGEDIPVSTGLILPAPAGSPPHLMEGWQELGGAPMPPEGLWVQSQHASFRFYAVAPGDPTLEFEARPISDDETRRQSVSVQLNDVRVGLQLFEMGWAAYEMVLPAEHVRAGWNRIDMSFRYTMRPSDQDPDSTDPRRLAAAFRRLAVRSPLNRPLWPDGPQQVTVSNVSTSSGPLSLEMPTDSIFEAYAVVSEGARLVGAVDVDFSAGGKEGRIHAAIEILGAEAETMLVFERSLESEPRSPARIDVDLEPWAGELVKVRVRAWGERNGIVHWLDLGLTSSPGEARPGRSLSYAAGLTSPPVSGRLDRPDIVFVMLDAARADAFLDRGRDTLAPNVVSLAAEGTRFSNAWSPSSWTGQTVPSLLTGLYPDAIGAETWASRIPDTFASLPQILADAGYRTVVWSHHTIYRGNGSLRRGFEEITHIDQNQPGARNRLPTAEELFADDRPTFALIHLLPPHGPYYPPEPFGGSLSGWYTGDFRVNARNLNRFGQEPRDPDESAQIARYARALYNENVRYADHLVGEIMQTLRQAGRYDNTLVVVLSDHGEAFLEHGRFMHTRGLYEEYLRVPLIMRWPQGIEGFTAEVLEHVSLIDLAPTLVDGLGIEDGRAYFQGRSLLPLAFGESPGERMLFAYTHGTATPMSRPRQKWAAQFGNQKLIFEPWPRGPADRMIGPPNIELYDLASDPGEQVDLMGASEFIEGFLMQELQLLRYRNAALFNSVAEGQLTETLDPEVLRELRALGYIQ